jgi:hypothetical protein
MRAPDQRIARIVIEADRVAIIGDRVIEIGPREEDVGAIEVGLSHFALDVDRRAEIGNGVFIVAFGCINRAAIVVGVTEVK